MLAGHDVSDGGLITCLLEMSFAGISGISVYLSHKSGSPIDILFSEELGWILEVDPANIDHVIRIFKHDHVPAYIIGNSKGFGLQSQVSCYLREIGLKICFLSFLLLT